jgi:hypothetical protein
VGEKFLKILWRKKVQFGTTFVIASSSDSTWILNYSKDSKSSEMGSVCLTYADCNSFSKPTKAPLEAKSDP